MERLLHGNAEVRAPDREPGRWRPQAIDPKSTDASLCQRFLLFRLAVILKHS